MMPFVLGDRESLPDEVKCYYDLILACPYAKEEEGHMAYLTIQESYVTANSSQHCGGLHIESPCCFSDSVASGFTLANEPPWGCSEILGCDVYDGGICIPSNRSDTTKAWDALVDSSVPGIVDRCGRCEYLRPWLNEGTTLKANELIWMTDRTPHDVLIQKADGHRQFFQLVIGGRDGNNV
jgi:hypothetical protein